MGLFGFLKEEEDSIKSRPARSGRIGNDEFDESMPIVIRAGSFSSDGILYASGDALCMDVVTDY